jgi:chaperone required for assembly of F1-ATPase
MKRFWQIVQVVGEAGQFGVQLDSRPVKLPSGAALRVQSAALAEGIAFEWNAVATNFTPDDLPLTRLASTAQERIAQHRTTIIAQLAAYGMNDLLCYRAATPPQLAALEEEKWGVWLRWLERTHGIALAVTTGLTPIDQPPEARAQFAAILDGVSNETIAALGVIVPTLGSLVLGLALEAGRLDPEGAADLSALDELWQETQWGRDDEAVARRANALADVASADEFMRLSRG